MIRNLKIKRFHCFVHVYIFLDFEGLLHFVFLLFVLFDELTLIFHHTVIIIDLLFLQIDSDPIIIEAYSL